MHPRLKKIIFNKLYEDLKHVEIIPYNDSIWFIDREKKYWYLQYEKSGYLWWRYDFFPRFFRLFSMERSEFELVIADWVEEVLNFKVGTTLLFREIYKPLVEEVLNFKVGTTVSGALTNSIMVEEVLNFKVGTTNYMDLAGSIQAEEVLNFKVNTTSKANFSPSTLVEEVLNFKVDTTKAASEFPQLSVEEVLNFKVDITHNSVYSTTKVEEILNSTL